MNEDGTHLTNSGGSQCGSRCASDKMCTEQSQAGDNSWPGLQTHHAGGGTCSLLQLLRPRVGPRLALKVLYCPDYLPSLRNSGQMSPFPGNSFLSSIIRIHKFFPIFLFTYMPPPTPPELPKSLAGIRLPDLENELFAASSH